VKYKLLSSLFAMLMAVFSTVSFSQNMPILAEKHIQNGLNCAGCHSEEPPTKAVATERCQSCHGDYEAMKARTQKLSPNPHYTHMGDQPCGECHRAHKTSVNMCSKCHKIDLHVK